MHVTVVLPARNEAEGLRRARCRPAGGLARGRGHRRRRRLLRCHRRGRRRPWRAGAVQPYAMGNGAAIKRGARAAAARSSCSWMRTASTTLPASRSCWPGSTRLRHGGGRARPRRPGQCRARPRQRALQPPRQWMTGHRCSTSPPVSARCAPIFREFLHLLPNGFSYPTTSTMGLLPQRLPGGLRAGAGGAPGRHQPATSARSRRRPFPADHLQDRHPVFAAPSCSRRRRWPSSSPGSATTHGPSSTSIG